MKRKLLMNAFNMIILIPLTFSLSGCEDLQKIIPEQFFSEENGETDSKNEDLQLKEEELIGRWYLRVTVGPQWMGFEFYPDGSWLAIIDNEWERPELIKEENLSGTWDYITDGCFEIYNNEHILMDQIYPQKKPISQTASFTIKNYNVYGHEGYYHYEKNEISTDLGQRMAECSGSWIFPNGAVLKMEQEGTWNLYDDTDTWLFGGRWIIEGRGYPTHIRMHSPTGDNGNNRVCYAILDDDASETPMLETEWVSDLTDFTGSDVILYKKAE